MSTTRGQQLIGKVIDSCILEQLLGYGGSSAVFLAQRQGSEQKVAVKIFLPRPTMNIQMQREFYRRFLHEAEAASKLHHPQILPIYAYGTQDGLPYIVMPYMAGGTLSEYVNKHGCLSLREAERYLEQIASALDYAHSRGFVHCDVKPANILLDDDGNAALSDFGIARALAVDIENGQRETNNGASQSKQPEQSEAADGSPALKSGGPLMGTPDYISPEQALGQPLDGRSDVYSLAITLFYLLAGHLPFKADTSVAVALLHVHQPPPSLSLVRADISPEIDKVIHKALAKQPEERYQSAGELSRAFSEAIRQSEELHHIDPTRPPSFLSHQGKSIGSKPVMRVIPLHQRKFRLPQLVIAGIVILALVVGAVFAAGGIASHIDSRSSGRHDKAHANPVGNNGLIDNLTQSNDWPIGSGFFFAGGQYHVKNTSSRYAALALYANHFYTDFRLSVTTAEIHGSHDGADYYGVIFRSSSDLSQYYLFEVTSWEDGQYQFLRYDGNKGWTNLAAGAIPSFSGEAGASNTITIEAKGRTFLFLVNNQPVHSPFTDTAKSTPPSSGQIGLYVEENGSEVAFSHLYISPLH